VIGWHARELLPDATGVTTDARTRVVHGDFFARVGAGAGFDDENPGRRFDAVLVDIDHTPRHVLDPSHAAFYTAAGLGLLTRHLHPGGVFALWSDDPPDAGFVAVLSDVFARADAHVVSFANPLTGGEAANTVYVAA